MKSFKIDLYDVTINVICCEKWREEVKCILAKENYEEEKELENADGFAMKMPGKNGFYVCFSPEISNSTVYHECIHLLVFVMNSCHLILDVNNSESIAYLGAYIIDETMKIKNHNFTWVKKQAIKKPRIRTIKNPSAKSKNIKAIKKAVKKVIADKEKR